jgi:hypothetical protein
MYLCLPKIFPVELFNKMVKPILLYGSEIWGFSKHIQRLEKVELDFASFY